MQRLRRLPLRPDASRYAVLLEDLLVTVDNRIVDRLAGTFFAGYVGVVEVFRLVAAVVSLKYGELLPIILGCILKCRLLGVVFFCDRGINCFLGTVVLGTSREHNSRSRSTQKKRDDSC